MKATERMHRENCICESDCLCTWQLLSRHADGKATMKQLLFTGFWSANDELGFKILDDEANTVTVDSHMKPCHAMNGSGIIELCSNAMSSVLQSFSSLAGACCLSHTFYKCSVTHLLRILNCLKARYPRRLKSIKFPYISS